MRRISFLSALFALALVGATASCGKESGDFTGKSGKLQTDPANKDPGNEMLPPGSTKSESFQIPAVPQPVDFLFVIDSSVSMDQYMSKVLAGFRAVPDSRYPPDSLMAVMTSMPSALTNFAIPHPDVNTYPGIEKEPGFLDLANQTALTTFKAAIAALPESERHAKAVAAFPQPMCTGKWFSPHSDSPTPGVSCLEAAFQRVGFGVGVEASLTAVKQLMAKRGSNPVFRPNAFVNVVFVGDAHDPGFASTALKNVRPNLTTLRKAVTDNSPTITGIKFHGILPSDQGEPCGEMRNATQTAFTGYSILPIVRQSNGVLVNICTQTDYSSVAEQIAQSNRISKTLTLTQTPNSITEVKVNGVATTAFTVEGSNLILTEIDSNATSQIAVTYVVQ